MDDKCITFRYIQLLKRQPCETTEQYILAIMHTGFVRRKHASQSCQWHWYLSLCCNIPFTLAVLSINHNNPTK